MPSSPEPSSAESNIVHDHVVEYLRKQHPFMKTEAAEQIAAKCELLLSQEIIAQQPTIEATKSRISFLSLSPELRNHIYELVLVSKHKHPNVDGGSIYLGRHRRGRMMCIENGCPDCIFGLGHVWIFSPTRPPSLLRVSQQTRKEAASVYYGANTFVARPALQDLRDREFSKSGNSFSTGPNSLDHIKEWLVNIGEKQASMIRSFHVGICARTSFDAEARSKELFALGLRASALSVKFYDDAGCVDQTIWLDP